MHLIFNELSFLPIAGSNQIAEERFAVLLQTFNIAQERFGFNHIRFPQNHADQKITTTQTFYQWISSITNRTTKNLILGLFKKPFMDDLEQDELNTFFESEYNIDDASKPTNESPIGLPIAHIKSLPAISLDSHEFWHTVKIRISKTNVNKNENSHFYSYNISLESDINSEEIDEWSNSCFSEQIETEEDLVRYLGYNKYEIVFLQEFIQQFFQWKVEDSDRYKYLLRLMKDVEIHPFTGGMGQTENLLGKEKEASKRVTQMHRLSYTIENNVVNFIACKGHYNFH